MEYFRTVSASHLIRALGAGTLIGVAFLGPLWWWTALVGLALFLHTVLTARSLFHAVLLGTVVGWLQYAYVLIWFWNTYPLEWTGLEGVYAGGFIFLYWSVTAFVLGLGKGLLAGALYLTRQKTTELLPIVLFPALLVLSEVISPVLFSIYALGPGGYVNALFTYGSHGYLLAEHALGLHLAAFGGLYLLTFFYGLLAVLTYQLARRGDPLRWYRVVGAVLLIVLSANLIPTERVYEAPYSVAALETSFNRTFRPTQATLERQAESLATSVYAALASGYDYIILPEDAGFTASFGSEAAVWKFIDTYRVGEVVLVDSGKAVVEGQQYLRALVYDTRTREVYRFDKQYLVPQGEYMPYGYAWLLTLVGFGDTVQAFAERTRLVPGPQNPTNLPPHIPGILFCFEAADPFGVVKATRGATAPFVAHIVSHGTFNEPTVLWHQLDQMLKVNTRFSGATLYQSANNYESARY